jgi:hypothetical protein
MAYRLLSNQEIGETWWTRYTSIKTHLSLSPCRFEPYRSYVMTRKASDNKSYYVTQSKASCRRIYLNLHYYKENADRPILEKDPSAVPFIRWAGSDRL